jgi:hypothetical protein
MLRIHQRTINQSQHQIQTQSTKPLALTRNITSNHIQAEVKTRHNLTLPMIRTYPCLKPQTTPRFQSQSANPTTTNTPFVMPLIPIIPQRKAHSKLHVPTKKTQLPTSVRIKPSLEPLTNHTNTPIIPQRKAQSKSHISINHTRTNFYSQTNIPVIQTPQVLTAEPTQEPSGLEYQGWNVHSYTSQLQNKMNRMEDLLLHHYGSLLLKEVDYNKMWLHLKQQWPHITALSNIKQHIQVFPEGMSLVDPELPRVNILIVMWLIYTKLVVLQEPSMWQHVEETFQDIGNTCIQGISHRLWADFIALYDN